jgi:hypothetical protein
MLRNLRTVVIIELPHKSYDYNKFLLFLCTLLVIFVSRNQILLINLSTGFQEQPRT